MAAKLDSMKLLQEIRDYAAISNRRPTPTPLGLLLAQMRPHVLRAALPRQRRFLRIEMQDSPEASVAITWTPPARDASPLTQTEPALS